MSSAHMPGVDEWIQLLLTMTNSTVIEPARLRELADADDIDSISILMTLEGIRASVLAELNGGK